MHWTRWRVHGDPNYVPPTPEERFWSRVDKTDGCWLWTGTLFQTSGYGLCIVNRSPYPAHRRAYELVAGAIPEGLQLDHLCRVRRCVKPEHLEPVTAKINLLRGQTLAAANAAKTHCPKGHPYDDTNTIRAPNGSRRCRECNRLATAAHWRKNHPARDPSVFFCGHPKTPENSYLRTDGRPRCRTCHRAYAAAHKN